tara:strand:- start:134 stop:1126 length:993 start_codon:yes stop_codon:yes gene_type:complete
MLCKHNQKKNGYFCKLCWKEGVRGKGLCMHGRSRYYCMNWQCKELREHGKKFRPVAFETVVASTPERVLEEVPGPPAVVDFHEGGVIAADSPLPMYDDTLLMSEKVMLPPCIPAAKKIKKERKRCIHGGRKNGYFCLVCKDSNTGGGGMCEHRVIRSQCKQCSLGVYRCVHGKKQNGYQCVKCFDEGVRDKGVCRHRKQRYICSHETCRHFTLVKLGASSFEKVYDFLGKQVRQWNEMRAGSAPISLEDCDLVYVKPLLCFGDEEKSAGYHYTNIQVIPTDMREEVVVDGVWSGMDDERFRREVQFNTARNFIFFSNLLSMPTQQAPFSS